MPVTRPNRRAPGRPALRGAALCGAALRGTALRAAARVAVATSAAALLAAPAMAGFGPFSIRAGWPITLGSNSVDGGLMINLDIDPELELVQVVGSSVWAFELDGTPIVGWPVGLDNGTFSAPAAGDIDGDGELEIIVNSFFFGIGGSTYAFERTGATVPGFPLSLGGNIKAPALGDVDGDGDDEIIVATNEGDGTGRLWVLQGDGSNAPGWPQPLDSIIGSGPAIGDVDGDGTNEIFVPTYDDLWGFSSDGVVLPGFPFTAGPSMKFNYNTPVLADLDGNGDMEIVIGASDENVFFGEVWALHHTGSPVFGWPRQTQYPLFTPASVADVDADGSLDVVIGDTTLSPTPVNSLYAWRSDGSTLPGFPVGSIGAIHAQVMIADVDGDGLVELFYDDNCAQCDLQAVNHDGTPLQSFPLVIDGSSFQQSVNFGDFDGDGLLDMAASGNVLQTGETALYQFTTDTPWRPNLAPVTTYQYDVRRSGVVPTIETIPCPADVNGSGAVNFTDLLTVLSEWGGPGGDVTGDGVTDFTDVLTVLGNWGPCE